MRFLRISHHLAMPTKTVPRASRPSAHPVRDASDALCRAARESCHQHERLSHVLGIAVDDSELQGVCDVTELCDRILADRTAHYEETAALGRGNEPEGWWHAANGLWMAAREYGRRHVACDAVSTRFKRHTAANLGELTMEYELEMSARLALKQAITAYQKERPEPV